MHNRRMYMGVICIHLDIGHLNTVFESKLLDIVVCINTFYTNLFGINYYCGTRRTAASNFINMKIRKSLTDLKCDLKMECFLSRVVSGRK
jgi:hypothetical protein